MGHAFSQNKTISNLTHQPHSHVLPANAKSGRIQRIKKSTFLCSNKADVHWGVYQGMLVRNTYMNVFQCIWSLFAIESINRLQRARPTPTLSTWHVVPRLSRSLASWDLFQIVNCFDAAVANGIDITYTRLQRYLCSKKMGAGNR